MNQKIFLRKELFWDTDINKINFKKDSAFVISRVLNYGNEMDYNILVKMYGIKKIRETAKKSCNLDNKSRNFWSNIFRIPLNLFKCKKKFLAQKQSMFLKK